MPHENSQLPERALRKGIQEVWGYTASEDSHGPMRSCLPAFGIIGLLLQFLEPALATNYAIVNQDSEGS